MRFTKFFLFFLIISLVVSIFVYPVSAANTHDYVDNNSSNVDSHAGHGTESSFAAEQSAPDSSYDTVTEAATSSPSNTTLFDNGFEVDAWNNPTFWTAGMTWIRCLSGTPTGYAPHAGTNATYCGSVNDGSIDSVGTDMSTATKIYVTFWWMDDDLDGGTDFEFYVWDGAAWDLVVQLNDATEDRWQQYVWSSVDSQYFDNGFKIRFSATPESNEAAFIDDVVIIRTTGAYNYEIDLERQWTSADYDETSEELCIYTGTVNGEALKVDAWNGSGWTNVIATLAVSQWNNVSISTYLTSINFTVRLVGATESSDTAQSAWQIDSMLLHTWTAATNHIADLSLASSTTWNLITQTNFRAIYAQGITSSWNTVTQWAAQISLAQTVTSSWSTLANYNTFVNLASSASLTFNILNQWNTTAVFTQTFSTSYSMIIQSAFNTLESLSSTFSFNTVMPSWSAIVDFTQTLTTTWSTVVQSSFNVVNSLSSTFSWIIDLIQGTFGGNNYVVDLSLSLTTAWTIINSWVANINFNQSITTTWNILIYSFRFPQNYIADLSLAISSSWVVNLISGLQLNVDLSLGIVTSWVMDWVEGNNIEEWVIVGAVFGGVIIGSLAFALFIAARKKDDDY